MAPKTTLVLKSAKPISKESIPDLHKGGFIQTLEEYADVETIAQAVKSNGIGSYEAFDVLDAEKLRKSNKTAAGMKTLVVSFITQTRKILEKYQVSKQLDVVQRGERVFLVSKA